MMERFLDIHMYITSALQKSDMRAVGLQLAMDLLYEKVGPLKHIEILTKIFHENIFTSILLKHK
jgi:hypothetical protein